MHPLIRLIAVDIDGTLLNSQFRISDKDLQALQQANQDGIEVILVTGRRHTFALPIAEQLGFDLWLISSNGAITRSLAGETFHRDLLPVETCRDLCSVMQEFRGNTVVTFDKESQRRACVGAYGRTDQQHSALAGEATCNSSNSSFRSKRRLFADPVQAMFCGTISRMQVAMRTLRVQPRKR